MHAVLFLHTHALNPVELDHVSAVLRWIRTVTDCGTTRCANCVRNFSSQHRRSGKNDQMSVGKQRFQRFTDFETSCALLVCDFSSCDGAIANPRVSCTSACPVPDQEFIRPASEPVAPFPQALSEFQPDCSQVSNFGNENVRRVSADGLPLCCGDVPWFAPDPQDKRWSEQSLPGNPTSQSACATRRTTACTGWRVDIAYSCART
jgi:hypothetical protein